MKDDPLALETRRGQRNGGEQRAGIRMAWIGKQGRTWPDFDDTAEMHHRDAIGNVLDHGEIVRNENVGQPKPVLQIAQQIEDLGADRDVERGDRFVANDEFRLDRQCPGNGNPLALAAGEFMRIAARGARVEPNKP